jgi:hypothetical protein
MKLTRTIVLGIAFLMPSISATMARAEDPKPAAEGEKAAAPEGEKKAKKKKAAPKKDEKKEEAPPAEKK